MSKRDHLVQAAEKLLWERGYEATSPAAILAESGAGQGSMYHHFNGKQDLALEAIENHQQVLWNATENALDEPGLDGVLNWLGAKRSPLLGCRLGRLVNEQSIRESPVLRAPIRSYFKKTHSLVEQRLREAQDAKQLSPEVNPKQLAVTLVSVVQGGFVEALAAQNRTVFTDAISGAISLLECASDVRGSPRRKS